MTDMAFMKLTNDLTALGDTEQAVAKKLEELDCKGTHDSLDCPIANYLKRLGYEDIDVCPDDVFASKDNMPLGIETPLPVSNFITTFDDGGYPSLYKKMEP